MQFEIHHFSDKRFHNLFYPHSLTAECRFRVRNNQHAKTHPQRLFQLAAQPAAPAATRQPPVRMAVFPSGYKEQGCYCTGIRQSQSTTTHTHTPFTSLWNVNISPPVSNKECGVCVTQSRTGTTLIQQVLKYTLIHSKKKDQNKTIQRSNNSKTTLKKKKQTSRQKKTKQKTLKQNNTKQTNKNYYL